MTTQTDERDLVIETKQECLDTSTVQIPSEDQKTCQAIPDQRKGALSSYSIRKGLVRFVEKLAVVYDLLVAPPATERGRIKNAMARARHDKYISFLR